MIVNNIISEKIGGLYYYSIEFEKDITEYYTDGIIRGGVVFKYDNKNWRIRQNWIVGIEKNIMTVSDFEILNVSKRRIGIIDDLLGE